MGREWKPGDVAKFRLVRGDGREKRGDGWTVGVRDNVGSWACAAATNRMAEDEDVSNARPLVVIDPEDREQVERLIRAYWGDDENPYRAEEYPEYLNDDMQAALRSLNEPPRPDEPQGLGAVVEDENGTEWARWTRRNPPGYSPWRNEDIGHREWSKIKAVKVLSEGVS